MNFEEIEAMKLIKKEYDEINKTPNSNIGVTIGLNDENNIFISLSFELHGISQFELK